MARFSFSSLRTRLFLAFAGVLIPYLALAAIWAVGLQAVWQLVRAIEHEALAELEVTAEIQLAIAQVVMPANDYLITGNPAERENFERRLARVRELLARAEATAFHDPEEQQLIWTAKAETAQIAALGREILALPDPRRNPAGPVAMRTLDQLSDEAALLLDRVHQIAHREVAEDIARGAAATRRAAIGGGVALLLSAAGAAGLALFFSAWLSRPLQALAQASRRIAEGNLSQRVEVHTGGEVGEAARAFNQMADALEQAEKDKADFTAMLVHDLRSPLMAVLSGAAILEDGLEGPVNEAQKKWLARIEAGVRKVVDLVNDFLDLSKIEAGRIELEKKEIDLGQLIRESLENYHALAQKKQITLKSCIDLTFPQIKADPRYLDQVLSNLLSNALKFTREGGKIEIGADREDKSGGQGSGDRDQQPAIRLWVKDTGVGIPAEELGSLFHKYRQTTSGQSSKEKGTGLGLVICKMIVEAHGGRIWVESNPGKGSTFAFTIPI